MLVIGNHNPEGCEMSLKYRMSPKHGVSDRSSPSRCDECPHQNYCPHFVEDDFHEFDYCGNKDACPDCGEEHGMYWDCQYGYDIRDGDAWGGFTGRSGG